MRKRKEPKPYELSDAVIAVLNKRIVKRSSEAKQEMIQMKFDELNVMKTIEALYNDINRDCKKAFRQLFYDRFYEMWLFMKDEKPDEDIIEELLEMELAGLFDEVNEQTHYIWEAEIIRKRDRAVEAIWASPSKVQKQIEVDKAMRILSQQVGFYTDIVSDDAAATAMDRADISRVMWNTQEDGKVCKVCKEREGKTYQLSRVPVKHLRCRCWLSPV